ncbi:hypothetical protein M0811_01155 [Anaeramoeba ignava]|uniref:Uncharacterized protein n=1 Tax=Anaeramoeba ignava TaxID=1746090 RepID=A0A9Q0LLD3_ANAIG|nr:hypothetical protein M0811_01155 [Anaeramoeba ignava]|eukprot:Anaeramoba_ignava/a95630_27.p1 GENE.a95630_27~~a95630_27.p1  ORF type:complete len:147 (+),score=20.05 a95630_27:155-595(+)
MSKVGACCRFWVLLIGFILVVVFFGIVPAVKRKKSDSTCTITSVSRTSSKYSVDFYYRPDGINLDINLDKSYDRPSSDLSDAEKLFEKIASGDATPPQYHKCYYNKKNYGDVLYDLPSITGGGIAFMVIMGICCCCSMIQAIVSIA